MLLGLATHAAVDAHGGHRTKAAAVDAEAAGAGEVLEALADGAGHVDVGHAGRPGSAIEQQIATQFGLERSDDVQVDLEDVVVVKRHGIGVEPALEIETLGRLNADRTVEQMRRGSDVAAPGGGQSQVVDLTGVHEIAADGGETDVLEGVRHEGHLVHAGDVHGSAKLLELHSQGLELAFIALIGGGEDHELGLGDTRATIGHVHDQDRGGHVGVDEALDFRRATEEHEVLGIGVGDQVAQVGLILVEPGELVLPEMLPDKDLGGHGDQDQVHADVLDARHDVGDVHHGGVLGHARQRIDGAGDDLHIRRHRGQILDVVLVGAEKLLAGLVVHASRSKRQLEADVMARRDAMGRETLHEAHDFILGNGDDHRLIAQDAGGDLFAAGHVGQGLAQDRRHDVDLVVVGRMDGHGRKQRKVAAVRADVLLVVDGRGLHDHGVGSVVGDDRADHFMHDDRGDAIAVLDHKDAVGILQSDDLDVAVSNVLVAGEELLHVLDVLAGAFAHGDGDRRFRQEIADVSAAGVAGTFFRAGSLDTGSPGHGGRIGLLRGSSSSIGILTSG